MLFNMFYIFQTIRQKGIKKATLEGLLKLITTYGT